MGKRLIIIGASAMGRETAHYAQECMGVNAHWDEVAGFLDTRTAIMAKYPGYPPIIATPEDYQPTKGDVFVCAVGDINVRLKYVAHLQSKGAQFVSVIHPKAYIGRNVNIGIGCIICPHSTIAADVIIRDHVIVNVNASISHDCSIGEGVTLAPGCTIAGWCEIRDRVEFGTHSAVLPRKIIVNDAIIGAGAVVVNNILTAGIYIGCPATVIKNERC